MTHRDYMIKAIELANKTSQSQDVPVGAIVVKDGKIVGEGYNTREKFKNALGHAEIMAIERACKTLDTWRLDGCTLYVTLEPCPMCAGAIINARLDRVVYGCPDMKNGAMGGKIDLTHIFMGKSVELIGGVMENECLDMLNEFFKKLR